MGNKRKIWLACGASLGLPLSALAQDVKDIKVTEGDQGISVQVIGDHLPKPSQIVCANHRNYYTLEWNAGIQVSGRTVPVHAADVASVWYGWFSASPRKVRMQIRTSHPIRPTLTQTPDGWTITVGEVAEPAASMAKAPPAPKPIVKSNTDSFPDSVPPIGTPAPTKAPVSDPAVKPTSSVTLDPYPDQVPPLDQRMAKKALKPAMIPTKPMPAKHPVTVVMQQSIKPAMDRYPDQVPPLDKPQNVVAIVTAPPVKHAAHPQHDSNDVDTATRHVSLECTNANLTEILKGLAMQSGANVIIGPGLERMTVSADLHDVTIDQALDYVSSLTGAKYAKVEGTYVVSPNGGDFDRTMENLINRTSKKSVVRVVPLASGDGAEVRLALNKWFSPGTLRVVDPNEATVQTAMAPASESGGAANPATAPASGGAAGTGAPAPASPASPPPAAPAASGSKPNNDNYIILIGDAKWVDAGEQFAREVDQKIVDARLAAAEKGREQQGQIRQEQIQEANDRQAAQEQLIKNAEPVTKSYTLRNGKAGDLKDAVTSQPGVPQISMVASPKDSPSQVIVCQGTEVSVDRMMALLEQLDTGSQSNDQGALDELLSYDVKFSDPRALREALVSQVPGLRVTLPPNMAANPSLYKEAEEKKQASDVNTGNTAAGQGGSNQGSNSGSSGGGASSVSTTAVDDSSFELPFSKEEDMAVPMRLLLRGTNTEIKLALRFLEVLDVAPKQVAIELRVMDLSKQDAINAGIDWNILTGGAVKIINLNNSQTSPSNQVGVSLTGHNFNGDVTASLDRIASRTNLIARPNLLAIDGRQTEIFVGDIVRYIESMTQSQNGTTITTGEVPVGVRLSILPRVGADGNLTLELRPRVSLLDSFTQEPNGGELPQTSSRMAQSTLMVKSGETIAIGGLIQDQDVRNLSGIPFLMNLPFIGHLFQKTNTTKQRTEVVIFVTARAIDGPVGSQDKLPMEQDLSKEVKIAKGGHH